MTLRPTHAADRVDLGDLAAALADGEIDDALVAAEDAAGRAGGRGARARSAKDIHVFMFGISL